MGYKSNPSTIYHEVASVSTATYNIDSHGSLEATYRHLTNADLPAYTAMFYTPTQHEQIASIKYHNTAFDYDSNLKEIKEMLSGPPLEVYVPHAIEREGLGSASVKLLEGAEGAVADSRIDAGLSKKADMEVLKEIEEARQIVTGLKTGAHVTAVRETEIEQEIKIKRRIKKREMLLIRK